MFVLVAVAVNQDSGTESYYVLEKKQLGGGGRAENVLKTFGVGRESEAEVVCENTFESSFRG